MWATLPVVVFHLSDHFCGHLLDLFQQDHILLVLRTPELDTVLQVGSHQSTISLQNHLAWSADLASFDVAQDTVGFLGCKNSLVAHVQFFIYQYSPSPFQQGCSQSIHPPSCIDTGDCPEPGVRPCTWPCWTSWCSYRPISQAYPGPSGWHPIPQPVNCTILLGVICKFAEGALNPTVWVINEDIKRFYGGQILI